MIVKRVRFRSDEDVIMSILMFDEIFVIISVNYIFVDILFYRFKNDWKFVFCIFSWAELYFYFEYLFELCDLMVDILGKVR